MKEKGVIHHMGWQDQLAELMEAIEAKDPKTAINEIASLSAGVPEQEAFEFFRSHCSADHYSEIARKVYSEYILRMENTTVNNILSRPLSPGAQFKDLADPDAKIAFDRVADIFEILTLKRNMSFVMVGCGQLPVTAIHVIERVGCQDVVCMDVVERAVGTAKQLKSQFGWSALRPVHCDGREFDFSAADVIYIANMVRPKIAVIEQVANTATPGCQVVVREPYGLGQLWADLGEAALPSELFVSRYGNGSPYLSRDVFLSWRLDGERHD